MTICAVKWCPNTSGKVKKCDSITYHRFPADPVIAEKWIKIIRLCRREEYWKPSKNSRICSKHFKDDDIYITKGGLCRIRKDAVPVKDLHCSCAAADHSEHDSNIDETSILRGILCSHLCEVTEKEETSDSNQVIQCLPETGAFFEGFNHSSDESWNDTPREILLREKLKKSSSLNVKYRKHIKILKQKLRRLKKKNDTLQNVVLELSKKSCA